MGIRSLLAERVPLAPVSDSLGDRVCYARDSWQRHLVELSSGTLPAGGRLPAAVVWPGSTEDVARIVELARSEGIPIVPFGAGSGVCAGIAPDERTIVVDLKRLSGFSIDRRTPLLEVGAGAMGINLEHAIQREGFTIGHFPSSIICSTTGGWVAARGAGQCSSRYGKIEDMLAAAECVLGNGRVVRFQRRSGGVDLLPLLVGSEGALGVITRLELRLAELPSERRFLSFRLRNGHAGTTALRRIMQEGLRPTVARLYDALDTLLMERSASHADEPRARQATQSSGTALDRARRSASRILLGRANLLNRGVDFLEDSPLGRWLLLLIFEGENAEEDAARASQLVAHEGGEALGEGPARRWYDHRYSVSFKQSSVFRSGAFNDTMEVAAPWSRLDELFDGVRRALSRHVLVLAHMSHAYPDGCSIYFTFTGPAHPGSHGLEVYDAAWRDALEAARAAGGAISHHHGIGRSKAQALARDLGPAVPVLRKVLRAWDPAGIMNPGVLLPEDATGEGAAPAYPELGLDERSELLTVAASERLDDIERRIRNRAFTLGHRVPLELTVGEWIASGLPDARDVWLDPVDHLVAGLDADLRAGGRLVLPPVPRRATGPDLSALIVGAGSRLGRATRCTLRVARLGIRAPHPLPYAGDRSPPIGTDERLSFDELCEALGGPC